MFYMDTRLTMGRISSAGIFNSLPDVVELIIKNVYVVQYMCRLLDDFLSPKA